MHCKYGDDLSRELYILRAGPRDGEYTPPPLQKMRITSELLRELVFSFQCVFLLHHLLFHPQLIPLNIQMS